MPIAILAFGSLIDDPGKEIAPLIASRCKVTTPFNVEFGRLSASRSKAPTLVPVEHGGAAVAAELLVIHADVTPDEGKSLLWRRETRREQSGQPYREIVNPGPNRVLIKTITTAFDGVDTVLYVDFPAEGKQNPRWTAQNPPLIDSSNPTISAGDRDSWSFTSWPPPCASRCGPWCASSEVRI